MPQVVEVGGEGKQFLQNNSLTTGISGANRYHLTKIPSKQCTQRTLHHYFFLFDAPLPAWISSKVQRIPSLQTTTDCLA